MSATRRRARGLDLLLLLHVGIIQHLGLLLVTLLHLLLAFGRHGY